MMQRIRHANRSRLAGLAGAALALLAARPAMAHWEYTVWGMTRDEVIAASRGAARALPAERERVSPEARMTYRAEARLAEGALLLEVAFAFDDVTGGLICVSFAAQTARQTQALRDWLTQRHGQPRRTARDPITNELTLAWRDGDNIDMHSMPATRPVVLQCAQGT